MISNKPIILLVDDDPGIQEFVQAALIDEGYEVILASNGQQALNLLTHQSVNLILLDLMMPIMDGWQFLAEAKCMPVLQSTPIVILSASTEAPQAAMEFSVKHYLPKPFDLFKLLTIIDNYVS
jgi:two-component system, chemotaxis family, chemotaxis protein CheY